MLGVKKEIVIDLSRAECWEKMRDISLASNYIPNVEKIEIISCETEGVGAVRKAYLSKRNKVVDETVIAWQDGNGFTLKLEMNGRRVLPWFNEFHFHYHIEEVGQKTLFNPAILYQPRIYIFLGLQKKVFDWVLGRELEVICASMKAYYETNEPTSCAKLNEIRESL